MNKMKKYQKGDSTLIFIGLIIVAFAIYALVDAFPKNETPKESVASQIATEANKDESARYYLEQFYNAFPNATEKQMENALDTIKEINGRITIAKAAGQYNNNFKNEINNYISSKIADEKKSRQEQKEFKELLDRLHIGKIISLIIAFFTALLGYKILTSKVE